MEATALPKKRIKCKNKGEGREEPRKNNVFAAIEDSYTINL